MEHSNPLPFAVTCGFAATLAGYLADTPHVEGCDRQEAIMLGAVRPWAVPDVRLRRQRMERVWDQLDDAQTRRALGRNTAHISYALVHPRSLLQEGPPVR